MERSVFDMTLDLQRSFAPGEITVRQGDTHRTLRFHLADGGKPYALTDIRAVLTAQKPDGSHLFNYCIVDGDRICYDLTSQTTSCPGQVECQLRLYGADDALLTTAAFTVTVENTVYTAGDEVIESVDEVTALTQLVTEVDKKIAEMEAVLRNEVNHAVIDDSRIGADAWSSKRIIESICPGFSKKGNVVSCDPVPGYPLSVTCDPGATTLAHCGKNLFDFQQGTYRVNYVSATSSGTRYGYAIKMPPGTYTLYAKQIGEGVHFVYGQHNGADGSHKADIKLVQDTTTYTRTVTVEAGDVLYVYDGRSDHGEDSANAMFSNFQVQIELGTKATDYAPYNGNVYTELPETVPALDGTNFLFADRGQVSVSGRVDIRPLLEKLLEE